MDELDLAYRHPNCIGMARPKALPQVEQGNSLSLEQFKARFLNGVLESESRATDERCCINLETSSSISHDDLRTCFNLIRSTSAQDYAASSVGWHPKQKLKEMRLPDLRYMLVREIVQDKTQVSPIGGFASFMLTYEDGEEVIYVYEIHLTVGLRGKGFGKHLMTIIEEVGRRAGMAKCMLTVFSCNAAAIAFYTRIGYQIDEFSPEPRKLRNGVIKEPDYNILSKPLQNG